MYVHARTQRDELRNSPPIDRVQGGEEVLKMLRVFSEHSVVFVNSGITDCQ